MGEPQKYFDYVSGVSSVSISTGAQDSITYEAAEQLYLKGEFDQAENGFTGYIRKFPNGYYILNASFYKAECEYRADKDDTALEGYMVVTASPRNIFTEKALLKSGEILSKKGLCDKAIEVYKRLEEIAEFRDHVIESQAGLMRCYHSKEEHENTILYARKLIGGDKVPNTLINEAHLMYGRSALALKGFKNATAQFEIVAKNSSGIASAEAHYNLAYISNKNGNYKESQNRCYKVINQVPSYEYWIGKSFILLADNYLALKDTFQAKHTYQSIIDNYQSQPNDREDLISLARQKLEAIINREKELRQIEILKKEEEFYNAEEDTTETILQPNE
jgi:TolA-binding protein